MPANTALQCMLSTYKQFLFTVSATTSNKQIISFTSYILSNISFLSTVCSEWICDVNVCGYEGVRAAELGSSERAAVHRRPLQGQNTQLCHWLVSVLRVCYLTLGLNCGQCFSCYVCQVERLCLLGSLCLC